MMSQHFLLSSKARSLSLAKVMRLTDEEAYDTFKAIRWADTECKPFCARCGSVTVYEYKARRIFKCKGCSAQFSATSGTIFASRKMPVRDLLAAISIFVNGVKGHSALQLSRDLDCQYKTAFVLAHKLREAMSAGDRDAKVSGEVEIDGAYFGGHVQPTNYKANRKDRRLAENQTGKRQVVIAGRERGGKTLTFVADTEAGGVRGLHDRSNGEQYATVVRATLTHPVLAAGRAIGREARRMAGPRVTGLMTKRAELAGLLEHHQAKVRQLMIDLDAIDQALRLFKPDIELDEIEPKPVPSRHAAYKGEVTRIVRASLRDAKRPCSAQELTMHVMAERGMNTANKPLVKTVGKRVGACLRHHRTKGLGDRIAWEVAQ